MSSLAPQIFVHTSPSSLFFCIPIVLPGWADLTVARLRSLSASLCLTRKQSRSAAHCLECQLQALALRLFKISPNVSWLKENICKWLILWSSNFPFSSDAIITVTYQSLPLHPSAHHCVSPPPCFRMICRPPPLAESSSIDICAAFLLPAVKS